MITYWDLAVLVAIGGIHCPSLEVGMVLEDH